MIVKIKKHSPTLKEMFQIPIVGGGKINPAGDKLVFGMMHVDDFEGNQIRTSAYIFDLQTGRSRPFITNEVISQSYWINNDTLAIRKLTGDCGFQIFIYQGFDGPGRQITTQPGGIDLFAPLKNGFVYSAKRKNQTIVQREEKLGRFKFAGESDYVTGLYFIEYKISPNCQSESGGDSKKDNPPAVPVVDLSPMLERSFEIDSIVPCPHANTFYLNCRKYEDEFSQEITDFIKIDLEPSSYEKKAGNTTCSSQALKLALPQGAKIKAVSPDGTAIIVLFKEGGSAQHSQSDLWVLDLQKPQFDIGSGDLKPCLECITSTLDQEPQDVYWTREGIFMSYWNKSRCEIARLAKNGEPEVWNTGGLSPITFFLNDSAQISMRAASSDRLAEVYCGCPHSKGWDLQRVTGFNEQFRDWDFGQVESICWMSKDGTEIEGILRKPSNFQPDKKYPLLIHIHGGPAAVSPCILLDNNNRYLYPIAQFVNQDILVLEPNYRGSLGRGNKFLSLNFDHLGFGDMWDIESGIDFLDDQGFIDRDRIGCMGWSQGGYLSAYAAMQTTFFIAVSAGAALSDWRIYYAGSDEPGEILLSGNPHEEKSAWDKSAPISGIQNAKTPILFQHGENDQRVPLLSAMEMYRALKQRGVQTRLVIFSGQGHGFLRPKESYALMLQNFRWFLHYLKGEELDLCKEI